MAASDRRSTIVLVNGAGPGLGKTTLTSSLADKLAGRGNSVELFVEEDILARPEFAAVIREFRTRPRVELETLLDASRSYLRECERRAKDFYILDALLPYWLSLAAWAYSDAEILQFLSDLGDLAGNARLVEIYLEGDLDVALARAAWREEPGWVESQIAKIAAFPQMEVPPRDIREVAAYYRGAAERMKGLRGAAPWPVEVIDTGQDPAQVLDHALRFLYVCQPKPAEADRGVSMPKPAPDENWVVGAIIFNSRGQIFVQKRSSDRKLFPGAWDIVGGHVRPGETLYKALCREVEEETGWTVRRIVNKLGTHGWIGSDGHQRKEIDFVVEVEGTLEQPRIEREKHSAVAWLSPQDLPQLLESRQPGDALVHDILKRAFQTMTGRE